MHAAFLEWLSLLRSLQIHDNLLTSTIPTQLGLLLNLDELSLSFNALSGTIPSQLGLLTRMEWLDLTGKGSLVRHY